VDLCNVELWRAGHDDARTLVSSITRLRRFATVSNGCRFGVRNTCDFAGRRGSDAVGRSDAPVKPRLDSLLRTGPGGFVQDR
jgi:hypothetical protein